MKKSIQKKFTERSYKIIVAGGGDDIERLIKKIAEKISFLNKSVAYVIVAAEKDKQLLRRIKETFSKKLENLFLSFGTTSVLLVESENFDSIYDCDIVILSGGDTLYLLKTLQENNFLNKIQKTPPKILIGISAGAIVLFEKGIGISGIVYKGLELIEGLVIPHSNNEKKVKYPKAIHLKDYEFISFNTD